MTLKQAGRVILKMMDRAVRAPKVNKAEIKAMKIAVYMLCGIHSDGCAACKARLRCLEETIK